MHKKHFWSFPENCRIFPIISVVRQLPEVKEVMPVCKNSRAGENARLRLGFSLICSRILPNVRFGFHQAMKARKHVLFRKYFVPVCHIVALHMVSLAWSIYDIITKQLKTISNKTQLMGNFDRITAVQILLKYLLFQK